MCDKITVLMATRGDGDHPDVSVYEAIFQFGGFHIVLNLNSKTLNAIRSMEQC